MTNSDIYMNIACTFLALAFVMRNFLFLRILSIFGSIFIIIYNLSLSTETSSVQINWESAFITINSFHLFIIFKDTFLIKLTIEEKEIHQSLFSYLSPKQFLVLKQFGEWEIFEQNQIIINEGDTPKKMYILQNGSCQVIVNNKIVAKINKHDFICEMNYISGEKASATVKAQDKTRVLSFDINNLKNNLQDDTISSAIIGAIGKNLAKKIKVQNLGYQ
ncbi:MAG: hypothetical protein COA79_23495 [Planctomycetota bacterium]|nr:MAG: hypothetical protein COA79_23495 [Planctomycetota bacterium]